MTHTDVSRGGMHGLWAGLALTAALVLLLARPDHYIANADDAYLLSWAWWFQTGGGALPLSMSRFLPGPEFFTDTFSLHARAGAAWFDLLGWSPGTLALYRALMAGLASLALIATLRALGMAAGTAAVPLVLFGVIGASGFRPEVTAMPLFLFGLLALFGHPGRTVLRLAGYLALFVAPLVAPSFLAASIGVLAVATLRRLAATRSPRILGEAAAMLALAVVVLGLQVDFAYGRFLEVSGGLAQSHAFGFSPKDVGRGALFAALAAYAWRRDRREAAALLAAVAIMQALGSFLHLRAPTSQVVTLLGAIAGIHAVLPRGRPLRIAGHALTLVGALAAANLLLFHAASRPVDPGPARAAVADLRAGGKTILADETAFIHLLDFRFDTAVAWTWSRAFPDTRPLSLDALRAGEAWVITPFTLHGILRQRHYPELMAMIEPTDAPLPYLACPYGRGSCRFPPHRYSYLVIDRQDGAPRVRLLGASE